MKKTIDKHTFMVYNNIDFDCNKAANELCKACSFIEELKARNIFVYCADMDGEPMTKTNLKGNIALVIGSEGFGVSKLTRKLADGIISIPMFGKINSLNASVSAGIVVYEAIRQRK